jgi:hypothetical protein
LCGPGISGLDVTKLWPTHAWTAAAARLVRWLDGRELHVRGPTERIRGAVLADGLQPVGIPLIEATQSVTGVAVPGGVWPVMSGGSGRRLAQRRPRALDEREA